MKIHVLFTGSVSRKVITGGDQLFIDIAAHLPESIAVVMVTPEFTRHYWDNSARKNIEFRFISNSPFDFSYNPLFIFLSYVVRSFKVYQILKKEKEIEFLYSCSDVAYGDVWPAYFLVGRDSKIKWITRVYHVILPPFKRQGRILTNVVAFYLQRVSFWMMKKRSQIILALNNKLYEEILALGFPKKKLGILGAGVDYEYIRNFNPTKKYSYDAVVLGRVAPVKGIFDMIKIWKKVYDQNPRLKLAWIGGGSDTFVAQIEQLIKENSMEKSFKMLGYIDKTAVLNILKSAKVFLCPDHENGWGLAVCEAMSAGLPVVAYDIDIFGGVYKQGYISCPLYDTDSFALAVTHVLADNKLREKLAVEAINQAKEFNHGQVVATLLGYLKKLPRV